MYYYDLFTQGPIVYIPVLVISLVITMLAYGAFPLIFSRVRKKQISKKKFTLLCYGVNLLVMIAFIAFGSKSSGGPYVLWTWLFSSAGIRKLDDRGVFDAKYESCSNEDEEGENEEVSNKNNHKSSETEQKVILHNRKRTLILDIINIFLLIISVVLSLNLPKWHHNSQEIIIYCGVFIILLTLIRIFVWKMGAIVSLINICVLPVIFFACCEGYEHEFIVTFIFALWVLLCELYRLIRLLTKIIIGKYHATQTYKIKCYKKIEKISTYREKGIITEEEFEKAREQIMSKIRY